MNLWDAKWDLDPAQCPCDIHFNEWIEANAIANKTIYHFGTGTHHIVGIAQAQNGRGNAVFAITASKIEYETYIDLVARIITSRRTTWPISATSISPIRA